MDDQAVTTSRPIRARHSSQDPSVEHRRERGRTAQAAFRKRQIDTIRDQKQQLRSMSEAFGLVRQAGEKLKLGIELSAIQGKSDLPIQLASDIASRLDRAISAFGDRNSQFRTGSADSDGSTAYRENQLSAESTKDASSIEAQAAKRYPASTRQRDASNAFTSRIQAMAMMTRPVHDLHKPLVDMGPVLPSLLVPMPPAEIMPYLPSASQTLQTFAPKLYWTTLELGYRIVSGHECASVAPRLLAYHLPHHNYASLKNRLDIRLSVYRTGIITEDPSPNQSIQLISLIARDIIRAGEDVNNYLDPREVELYLRRKYIDPDNLQINPFTELVDESMADCLQASLLKRLASSAVCFGDGPKLRTFDVDEAITAVLSVPCNA